jgi:hypothetical protein
MRAVYPANLTPSDVIVAICGEEQTYEVPHYAVSPFSSHFLPLIFLLYWRYTPVRVFILSVVL